MIKILKGKIQPKSKIILREALIFILVNLFIFFIFNSNITIASNFVENNKNNFKNFFSILDYFKVYFLNFKKETKENIEEKVLDFILKFENQKKEIEKSLKNKNNFEIVEISWINNKGQIFIKDNLKAGVLMTPDFVLVGKVFNFDNSSKITSILETNFEFNIAKEDGEFIGLAKTVGLGLLETTVELDKNIKEDDLIFTSGKDGIFKPGIIVGKVVKVKEGPVNKKVLIKTFFEPSKTHYLVLFYD